MDSEVSLKFYSFYQNEKKIIINSFYKQQLKQTRMRRISLLLVSLIVLTIQTALAQSFSVKGTIVSADDNEPLIGATILQEGTTNGVATDIDGNYTIEVKGASKATLVISYIGMVTQKHSVNAQTKTLNVTLTSDSKVMDEVVVVAYGVRKK